MFFDIQVLEKRKIRFDHFFTPGAIGFLDDDGLKQIGDIHTAGEAELVDPFGVREIHIRGRVEGEIELPCARCLEPTRVPLTIPVDLYYRPMSHIAREEEIAISEAETEIGFYEGAGLELADVVREQVLMALPMRTTCREDCRGICPLCGADRNGNPCSCRESFTDPRWDVLKHWSHR